MPACQARDRLRAIWRELGSEGSATGVGVDPEGAGTCSNGQIGRGRPDLSTNCALTGRFGQTGPRPIDLSDLTCPDRRSRRPEPPTRDVGRSRAGCRGPGRVPGWPTRGVDPFTAVAGHRHRRRHYPLKIGGQTKRRPPTRPPSSTAPTATARQPLPPRLNSPYRTAPPRSPTGPSANTSPQTKPTTPNTGSRTTDASANSSPASKHPASSTSKPTDHTPKTRPTRGHPPLSL